MRLLKNKTFLFSLTFIGLVSVGIFWYLKRVPEFNLESLRIELDDAAYDKLSKFREVALEKGHLERSDDDFVPTSITYRSQLIDGKLRLKGDWLDHLATNKWSFRIKLDLPMNDGLKEFSVQNPACRDYVNGYLFYDLMKEEGIMTNEFRFIQVYVNSARWGVYALEEHLTTRMIRHKNRPNGVLIKFSDQNFFTTELKGESTIGLIKEADFKVYGDAKKDEQFNDQIYRAKEIAQNYKDQTDSLYNDFDPKKMGKYYAICDLTAAYHAMGWINMRFYYNFETRLMEPVAYDPYPLFDWGKPYLGNNVDSSRAKDKFDPIRMVYKALENEEIHAEYMKALRRITAPEYIQKFMSKRSELINFYESEIQKEYKSYEFDNNFFRTNAKDIRNALIN